MTIRKRQKDCHFSSYCRKECQFTLCGLIIPQATNFNTTVTAIEGLKTSPSSLQSLPRRQCWSHQPQPQVSLISFPCGGRLLGEKKTHTKVWDLQYNCETYTGFIKGKMSTITQLATLTLQRLVGYHSNAMATFLN